MRSPTRQVLVSRCLFSTLRAAWMSVLALSVFCKKKKSYQNYGKKICSVILALAILIKDRNQWLLTATILWQTKLSLTRLKNQRCKLIQSCGGQAQGEYLNLKHQIGLFANIFFFLFKIYKHVCIHNLQKDIGERNKVSCGQCQLLTCLLYCIIPIQGNVQVQAAGRISLSAKFTHCCTQEASVALTPLRASLATAST